MLESTRRLRGWLRTTCWVWLLFLFALSLRIVVILVLDSPLLYTTSLHYYWAGVDIIDHPNPFAYVLGSDDWRLWGAGHWTVAPLYQLWLALVFKLCGVGLAPVRLLQCVLGAFTAVCVAALGRNLAGKIGTWAGVAAAVCWPMVELPNETLTENLHAFLLVAALTALALGVRGDARLGRLGLGGFLLGLSALTRPVSLAFLPIGALWTSLHTRRGRRLLAAGVVLASCMTAVLPWTIRNLRLYRQLVPIDTVSIFNLWNDNAFVDEVRAERQHLSLLARRRISKRSMFAIRFALNNIIQNPGAFRDKVGSSTRHFFRPEGLHSLLIAHATGTWWQLVLPILLHDLPFVSAQVLFVIFILAGPRSPTRGLLILWSFYYVFMIVVIFHSEIRYRSALLPLLFAGAAAGIHCLRVRSSRSLRFILALVLGLFLTGLVLAPYARPAWAVAACVPDLLRAHQEAVSHRVREARRAADAASARVPESALPYQLLGRWLAAAGYTEDALHAYRAASLRESGAWLRTTVIPRLLEDLGRVEDAERERSSKEVGGAQAWSLLEMSWRELEPPQRNMVRLGLDDYGIARGFLDSDGDHRFSSAHAVLRLRPPQPGRQRVVLVMGSPEPSPLQEPRIRVRATGSAPVTMKLDREVRPFELTARTRNAEPLMIEIESPTWSRPGHTPDQGVWIERVIVVSANDQE